MNMSWDDLGGMGFVRATVNTRATNRAMKSGYKGPLASSI